MVGQSFMNTPRMKAWTCRFPTTKEFPEREIGMEILWSERISKE